MLLEANIAEEKKLFLWSHRPQNLQDKISSQYFQSFGLKTKKNLLFSSLNLALMRHTGFSAWFKTGMVARGTTIMKDKPVSSEVLAPSICFASTF